MTNQHRYHAFLATIAAIVVMFIAACVLAYNNRSVEAIGISGALTGLIALAGTLAGQRQPIDPPNPVPVETKP